MIRQRHIEKKYVIRRRPSISFMVKTSLNEKLPKLKEVQNLKILIVYLFYLFCRLSESHLIDN